MREGGREGGREEGGREERERGREGHLLLSVCSTYLFIHESCFNAISRYIVRVDETEHFEEELLSISVRHDAL